MGLLLYGEVCLFRGDAEVLEARGEGHLAGRGGGRARASKVCPPPPCYPYRFVLAPYQNHRFFHAPPCSPCRFFFSDPPVYQSRFLVGPLSTPTRFLGGGQSTWN